MMSRIVHHSLQRLAAVVAACGLALAALPAASAATSFGSAVMYAVTDLGTLNGAHLFATDLNNLGQVVGWSYNSAGVQHAFAWDQGKMIDLGTLGGISGYAEGINDVGQIVGDVYLPLLTVPHAALSVRGGLHDLGTFQPDGVPISHDFSKAAAINSGGHVVGSASIDNFSMSSAHLHAFLDDGATMRDLGSLPGLSYSQGIGINSSDGVIGISYNNGSAVRAFLWQNGVMRDMTPLGATHSVPSAINYAGQVVGFAAFPAGKDTGPTVRGYFYDSAGAHVLGTLGGPWSTASGINNHGQIVGDAATADPGTWDTGHSFIYTGGVMQDLSDLLLSTSSLRTYQAVAINDRGQILLSGIMGSDYHAILLTPTPVPSLSLSAPTLDFSGQPAGTTRSFTITNAGSVPLGLQSVTLTGPDAGSFQIIHAPGAGSLAPGASQPITIAFSPASMVGVPTQLTGVNTVAASFSASVAIQDNDPHPHTLHQVALTAVETAPAAPTNLTASITSANQVALNWSDNSDNETAFAIWRQSAGGAYVRVGVVVPNSTQFLDTSVAPNSPYTYEVRAINNVGASAWSNPVTLATRQAPPAAPTGLTATAVAATEIDLAWTRGFGGETGIAIFRQAGSGPWQRIGVVPPSITVYIDRSVTPGTSYAYRVRAHNDTQVSAWTNMVSIATPPAP